MLKKIMLAAVLVTGSGMAMADNDVGCGIGSQVWEGQSGIIPNFWQEQPTFFSLTNGSGLLSVL